MPLTFAELGDECVIKKVGGTPEVKKHLEDLGFTSGAVVQVVSQMSGNLIVNVKQSRVAIDKSMAMKIMI